MSRLAFLLTVLAVSPHAWAQSARIDTQRSTMTVKVAKSGILSAFGHNHEIRAPIASGTIVSSGTPRVELMVDARGMRALDPDLSAKDRAEVQKIMHSAAVLDSARFPEIHFASRSIEAQGHNHYRVEGKLTLHGVARPVILMVEQRSGIYTGSAKLKQTDFGITPVTVAGGTVKVKDTVEIVFEIVAEPQSPAAALGVDKPAASGRSSPATATPSR